MERIQDLLNSLTATQEARAVIAAPFDADIADLKRIRDLDTQSLDTKITSLTDRIKNMVESHGATVKGTRLWAVYSKGRTSWDTKALMGFAALEPAILAFRKQGDPYVSIRKAKGVK